MATVTVDYEFYMAGGNPGNLPVPICYVWQNVDTGEVGRHWIAGDETTPDYPTGPEDTFVAYFASAEMGCHLVLNYPRPNRILDLFCEFRDATNGLKLPAGRGIIGALTYYGLKGGDTEYKELMRDRIIQGPPYTDEEKEKIMDYCQKDVEMTTSLYKRMVGGIDWPRALLRGRYMWAVAVMEHHGVPIDTEMFDLLQTNWDSLKAGLIADVDEQYHVYEGTTFKSQRFLEYLKKNKIPWDVTDTGLPKLDDDYMQDMAKSYTQLKPLQELRWSLGQLKLNALQVGDDGRNRALLSPFASRTGRNQPSSAKFIFGNATWLRSLIRPKPGMALAYIDYEQQEIAIAAALSGDKALKNAYESGDPYLSFAIMAGALPEGSKKGSSELVDDTRDKYKRCMLALNYGMSVEGFAHRSGLPLIEAKRMFQAHRLLYATYWEWSENFVDSGMLSGRVNTRYGWHLYTWNLTNRSLSNFPMQAHGADCLRVSVILALENGVKVVAPVHDALLIEAPEASIEADTLKTQRLMTAASEHVLRYPVRTDVKTILYPDRYMDKRGKKMWDSVRKNLGAKGEA